MAYMCRKTKQRRYQFNVSIKQDCPEKKYLRLCKYSLDGDIFFLIFEAKSGKRCLHPNIIWREAP